jgi:hypothetical protein
VKRAPRPASRLLLAGRYLVPRASLLALPDGPVGGLDLASGELVGLAFEPGADDAAALALRVARWTALGLAGCPVIRDVTSHLGRPLVAFDAPTGRGAFAGDRVQALARGEALGEALDAAGLGLVIGPADLALGPDGPYLRRPAIGACDPSRPLARVLVERAALLVARAPAPDEAPEPERPRRARPSLGRIVPRSRPGRIALVVAAGVVSAVVASSLTGASGGDGVAAAAPLARVLPAARVAPLPAVARSHRALAQVRPISRGGAARVLVLPLPVASRRPAPVAMTRAAPEVSAPPERGWVEGLFVAS